MMAHNVRAMAALRLSELIFNRRSLSDLLSEADSKLSSQDYALLNALCYGVCRWHPKLHAIYRLLLTKPLKAKDADIEALMLLGLYQLAFMRIPAHAAVNETVQASKQLGKGWAGNLINAVLRRFQRDQTRIEAKLQAQPEFQYAHPTWLIQRLRKAWPDYWQSICSVNNTQAPMTLRINQQKIARAQYLARLEQGGVAATATRYSEFGVQLTQALAVQELPGFVEGLASVQDESAQLAANLLEVAPGMRVLDACAAPGGKSCHLLEQAPTITLIALDKDKTRLARIQENLTRLQQEAQLIACDATQPSTWWDGQLFDRILLDAPCSAVGVIRRHPDIKLLRQSTDIDKLASQQLAMLEALWPLLKPGGFLVYATCSILPEENEQVIQRFLTDTTTAQLALPTLPWGIGAEHGRYLLPEEGGNDGFYYARLTKTTTD